VNTTSARLAIFLVRLVRDKEMQAHWVKRVTTRSVKHVLLLSHSSLMEKTNALPHVPRDYTRIRTLRGLKMECVKVASALA
jgi:hypothetical protein